MIINGNSKIISGINKSVDLVKTTLGREGKLVVMDNPLFPKTTKDGYSIIRAIQLEDVVEQLGVSFVNEACTKTNEEAADNTTTTAVLVQAIVNNASKAISKGVSPVILREGIKKAEKDIIEKLNYIKRSVEKSEIYDIAKTASNGDNMVASLIQQAYDKISLEGVVEIEETTLKESKLELANGLKVNKGIISHYLFTDVNKQISEIYNVNVLIFDGIIDERDKLKDVISVLQAEENTSLLIVCDEIENDVANWLIEAQRKKMLSVSIIKNPYYDKNRFKLLEDIAAFTDGEIYSPDLNSELKLGKADKVTTDFDSTLIQRKEKSENLDKHIETLKFQEETSRVANLSSNVAVIFVGGTSTSEVSELKDRFDDAVGAVRNALLEGVVVGGGCALKHIAKALKSDDIGYNVLLKSICEPFYQILTNASIEYLDIFGDEKTEIKRMKLGQIYNTNTKKIEYSKDVFDTVKGLRCAVQNSVSVSNIVLSIDGALC